MAREDHDLDDRFDFAQGRAKVRCFACDRLMPFKPNNAITRDGQAVHIGSECAKKLTADGWQPPKGGPKLYPLTA